MRWLGRELQFDSLAIMHNRPARTQWRGVDKYVGEPKNSYVIIRLA